jgi:hypothetical protein
MITVIDIRALEMVDEAYADRTEWIKKSIRTTAKASSPLIHFTFETMIFFLLYLDG